MSGGGWVKGLGVGWDGAGFWAGKRGVTLLDKLNLRVNKFPDLQNIGGFNFEMHKCMFARVRKDGSKAANRIVFIFLD